jgi:NAD(P)-dependent dehydrogenase (short-subunit alcohol dehydrogenase family)
MPLTRPSEPVVLITGATGGVGRVTAGVFAGDGARLGLAGRDLGRLTAVAAEVGLTDDRWAPGVGDLTDPAAARAAVEAVAARFGRIDGWLHLVGGWAGGTPVVDLDHDELRRMLDQHLWTTLNVAQVVVPGMIEREWGRVVAVSTPLAMTPGPRGASYAVAKAAEDTFIRALSRELGGTGVTANLVVVKQVATAHEREAAPSPKHASSTTPEEIAATLRYLCSDDAAAINGARIPLDGR